MSARLFVYGTLKDGGVSHRFLKLAKRGKDGVIDGYDMFVGGEDSPGIRPGQGRIFVETYLISKPDLIKVDRNENEGKEYDRKLARTRDGRNGFIYILKKHPHAMKQVESGLWEPKPSK